MPRKPREHFPGAIYHTILRGNNRRDIFFYNEDRRKFYSLLEEGVSRFAYRIHAFCLMTNHVHLAIEISDIPISKIMQNLAFRYAQWINKKFNQIGHLFQGRYKAILVQNQSQLADLCRYIHLNPLKAKMIENLDDYPWSSHLTYMGKEQLSWVFVDEVLSVISQMFSNTINYLEFIKNAPQEQGKSMSFALLPNLLVPPGRLNQGILTLDDVINTVSQVLKIEKSQIFHPGMQHSASKARTLIAIFGRKFAHVSLQELALVFNRDASTISHSIYRWQIRQQKIPLNSKIYAIIQESLCKIKLQA